jgi:hypothetical protein
MKKMRNQERWTEVIKRLPAWISGSISFITAIVGFMLLLQGNYQISIKVITFLAIGALFFFSLYIAFAKTPPLIEGGRGVYTFGKYRGWAFVGMGVTVLLLFLIVRILQNQNEEKTELISETVQLDANSCFREFFEDIPSDRVFQIESGADDIDLIGPDQPKNAMLGILFTEWSHPVGAIRILPVSSNKLFKIDSVIDEKCRQVEAFENITRGGDKHALKDADTVQMYLSGKQYNLRVSFYAGSAIRIDFHQSIP